MTMPTVTKLGMVVTNHEGLSTLYGRYITL